ncbi:MAG: hypothetical protein M1406_08015 [Nitrospirae bacterium]|nr:hypothetical protein [Nitrospirota bacterium]
MANKKITEEDLLKTGIKIIRDIQKDMLTLLTHDRLSALEIYKNKWKSEENITRGVDVAAENRCKAILYGRYGTQIFVLGEESLRDETINLTQENRIVALLDMVDGTDLLSRDLHNWCSAILFFNPSEKKIISSLVGDPFGQIYYATYSKEGAYKIPFNKGKEIQIKSVPVEKIEEAYVCFYGQKKKNLLSITSKTNFLSRIYRIYNLGGNPMMVKVAEGVMNAVFELCGQKPHDVIPGAFIAKKAGAFFEGIDEKIILEDTLLTPSASELKYILACSESLWYQLKQSFTSH